MDEQDDNKKEKSEENGVADAAQKTGEAVQDTAQAVKDGANLAKNISTGNVLGIIKDAVNLLKNKQVRKILLVSILASMIVPILLASLLFGIFNAVGEAVQNSTNGMTEWFQKNYMFGIIFYTNEQLDEIIKSITNLGIDLDDLHLMGDIDYSKDDPEREKKQKEALKKYLVKFLLAQEKMQTLNPRPTGEWWDIKYIDDYFAQKNIKDAIKIMDSNQDLTYGNVYVHRTRDGEPDAKLENQLQYLAYDTFIERVNNNDENVLDHFSVDENGNLVYAKKTKETVEKKKNGKKVNEESSETIKFEIERIDYKSTVSPYTTSVQFFIYLTMITQNPEFASAVADLAANGEIRIMIMDNKTMSTEKVTYKYTENTKTREKKDEVGASEAEEEPDEEEREAEEIEEDENDTGTSSEAEYIDNKTSETVTEETTTTKEEINSKLAIIYVNTWFSEQEITYQKVDKDETSSSRAQTLEDEEEPELTEVGEESWRTNQTITNEFTYKSTEYVESVHGTVTDKTDDFISLLDKEFKIPNTNRKEAPGSNLVSGADWFLGLLKMDPYSQNIEQVMRIILNKYTGTDRYGDITWNDISNSFDAKMTSTGNNYIVDTTKSDSKLVITDKEVLKEAISKLYSGQMKENLTSEVENFIGMQEQYHVNAVFAMAVTVVESGAGTNWDAIDESTHNWYSITGSYNGQTYRNPNSSNPRTWCVYPSFKEATYDFGNLIANSIYYFKAGKTSVEEIAPVYCSEEWGKSVISIMNSIYNAAGIEIQSDGFIIGGVQTEEARQEMQDYIESNLINTKVHKGDSNNQDGPFAKWWQNNGLVRFQCTWWANGRASMYLEKNGTKYTKYPTISGNGGDYYDVNEANGWFNSGKTPKANSIVSWKGGPGGCGHVAYVEGVTSDGIYISHAGKGNSWYGVQFVKNGDLASIGWSGYTLNGYIYLDEPKK